MLDTYKSNFLSVIAGEILDEAETRNTDIFRSAPYVVPRYLDIDDEEIVHSHGPNEHGVDFYRISGDTFQIYQVKMKDMTDEGKLNVTEFDSSGVQDLKKAYCYLANEVTPPSGNNEVKRLKELWNNELMKLKRLDGDDLEKLNLEMFLVVLGDGLRRSAQDELDEFVSGIETNKYFNISFDVITISNLIEEKWVKENYSWKDMSGFKKDTIQITPEEQSGKAVVLEGKNFLLFYARGVDLVNAFNDLGYQIFEPNVRCHIPKSKVNDAIKETAQTEKGQKAFRHFNNGVTIITTSYQRKKRGKYYNVRKPGIINGCQTVVSLSEVYNNMSLEDKDGFERNCYVLVKIIRSEALPDHNVNELVKATNFQNKMEPRNYVSNNTEQLIFEKLFAEEDWFYSRKDGAWEAFKDSYKVWRNLPGRRPSDFKTADKIDKVMENEDVAQSYLSYVGFSREATNRKKDLFDEDKRLYSLGFKERINRHAREYDYELNNVPKVITSPDHKTMVMSYLIYQFVRTVTPTPHFNRKSALERLGVDPSSTTKEQQDTKLVEDIDYLVNQALANMPFVVVELYGYIFWKVFGDNWSDSELVAKILINGTMGEIYKNKKVADARERFISDGYDKDDLIYVMYGFIKNIISGLMSSSSWKESYLLQSRVKYLHNIEERKKFSKEAEKWNKFFVDRMLPEHWASGIEMGTEFYSYIGDVVRNN